MPIDETLVCWRNWMPVSARSGLRLATHIPGCAWLAGWQPPRVVVVGNQSEGKSAILERLCMMPLFPRSKSLCTSVPVKISTRCGAVPRPPTRTEEYFGANVYERSPRPDEPGGRLFI